MSKSMIVDKLEGVKLRFEEVGQLITDPDVIADMKRYVKLTKEYKDLEPLVETYNEYKELLSNIDTAKDMLSNEKDPDMKEMAKMELE
ncbi:MAG: PCRF domain-containing protein, partial [Bacteroidota bacterium]|nr:PCRF domain-containing protein [Bacteroidota bacterium]